MPVPIARLIAESTDQTLVVLGRQVYAVRRVNSDQLRRHGWATLEGAASVQEALRQAVTAREELEAKIAGLSDEEITAARERVAALEKSYSASLVGRPEGALAYLDRLTAYVCAAVVGAGVIREGAERPQVEILDGGFDLSTIAVDLRDADEIAADRPAIYLAPMRFTRVETEEDLDQGVAWVYRLSEQQRSALGEAIGDVQSVATEVACFRLRAGARGPDLEDRGGDGSLAPRSADADGMADGVRAVVQGGPRKGRGRAGEGREAGASDRRPPRVK